MANKTHAHTTKLFWDVDGVDPYTQVADVKTIGGVDLTRGDTNITHLDSVNRAKEYMGTALIEGGEVPFGIFFGKAEMANLVGHFNLGTTLFWRMQWPLIGSESTPSKWEFQGYLKKCQGGGADVDSDDAVMCEMAIKITGRPSFMQGS